MDKTAFLNEAQGYCQTIIKGLCHDTDEVSVIPDGDLEPPLLTMRVSARDAEALDGTALEDSLGRIANRFAEVRACQINARVIGPGGKGPRKGHPDGVVKMMPDRDLRQRPMRLALPDLDGAPPAAAAPREGRHLHLKLGDLELDLDL